jgi:predicted metal-dependent phosphoesterase TrpH
MLVDFHTHSYYSDGTLSPTDLIKHAKEVGLDMIALTDHDTIKGIEEAQSAAIKYGVKLIKGLEISTFNENGLSMHILGLDIKNLSIIEDVLQHLKGLREKRNVHILEQLKENYGIDINYSDMEKEFKGTIGKGNISQYLTHKGYYPTYKDANMVVMQYRNFLCGIEVEKAINLIHQAGGLAFLAHPHSLKLNDEDLEKQIVKLQNMGLDGLEYAHSNHTLEQTQLYKNIAHKLGLKLSAGSDYHGAYKENVRLIYGKSDKPLGDASIIYLANK